MFSVWDGGDGKELWCWPTILYIVEDEIGLLGQDAKVCERTTSSALVGRCTFLFRKTPTYINDVVDARGCRKAGSGDLRSVYCTYFVRLYFLFVSLVDCLCKLLRRML